MIGAIIGVGSGKCFASVGTLSADPLRRSTSFRWRLIHRGWWIIRRKIPYGFILRINNMSISIVDLDRVHFCLALFLRNAAYLNTMRYYLDTETPFHGIFARKPSAEKTIWLHIERNIIIKNIIIVGYATDYSAIRTCNVSLPSGGTGKRCKYVDLCNFTRKRCFIPIQNNDELCCARAIVTAKARFNHC